MTISADAGTGGTADPADEPDGVNPNFLAEWEAMSEAEYEASIRDIPDEILDAAPPDLPEEIWLALKAAEAGRLPDVLTDAGGPVLAGSLAGVDDAEVGDGGLIDRITGFGRQASWAVAGQFRAVAELATRRVTAGGPAELGFVVDELALALTCSRYAAWAGLHTALDLSARLPATLAALAAGRICAVRARIIAEGTRALTDTDAALVQDEVLPAAQVLSPGKLRARVTAAVAAVGPRQDDEAHQDACAARTVRKYPREHGMTGIWALLPADQAAAVWAAVNTHAETSKDPGDERTADQRRADSLTELMTAYLNGDCPADQPHPPADADTGTADGTTQDMPAGATPAPPPRTAPTRTPPTSAPPRTRRPMMTPAPPPGTAPPGTAPPKDTPTGDMPADAGASVDNGPAGDPQAATATATATGRSGCRLPGGHRPPRVPAWCRVQVKVSADWLFGHSTEAPVLAGHGPLPAEVGLRLIADAGWQRIVYDPLTGALLDVGTTVHDPPAPLREHVLIRDGGCTQPICANPRVDLDHNLPYPHGPTSAGNLRSRCRHDHRLKQHPDWQVRVGPDGRIDWITPTGHAYPEHQPDLRPGPSTRPRPDPDIGPDPPAERPDETSDPPPY